MSDRSYKVVNELNEEIAVVAVFEDGTCVVHHPQTVFDSIEDVGRHFNGFTHLEEIK